MSDFKIVIISGQEFQVPADTDNEAIRQQLKGDFPDIAAATIKEGKRDDGTPTVEFVKRAGTKGLLPAPAAPPVAGCQLLLEALRQLPAHPLPHQQHAELLRRLVDGDITFAEALDDKMLENALLDISTSGNSGEMLCSRLDTLGPVPALRTIPW